MNTLMDIVAYTVMAVFALMIVGLGYFVMSMGLQFGWITVLIFLALIALVGVLEGAIMTFILAPFSAIQAILKGRRNLPSQEQTDGEKAGLRLLRNGVLSCLAFGAVIATVQFLITGGVN